jgi:hypothetical protein
VSVKIESTKRVIFNGLAGKTSPNNLKNLARRRKTIRAATGVQSRAALTNDEGYFRHGY